MKEYLILKDFKGTQDGFGDGEQFRAGAIVPLSDMLVNAVGGVSGGYVKEASKAAAEIADAHPALAEAVLEGIENAELQPRELAEGEMLEEGSTARAEDRETKVVGPEETKPMKPLSKMTKAELADHALTTHGLELKPDDMTAKEMVSAIEAAPTAGDA